MWWWRSADWGNTDSTHRKKYKLKKWYFFFLDTKDSSPEKKRKKGKFIWPKMKKKKISFNYFFHWKKKVSWKKRVHWTHTFFLFQDFFLHYVWHMENNVFIYHLYSVFLWKQFFPPTSHMKKIMISFVSLFHGKKKIHLARNMNKNHDFFSIHCYCSFIFWKVKKKKLWQDKWIIFLFRIFFYCPHLKKNFSWKKNHLSVLLETNLCSCENFFFSLGPTH